MTTNSSGESRVVVLSYNYWSSRFGLNPTVLNKQLIVNGQSLTIVGAAPKGFDGTTIGMRPAVFVPITLRALLDVDTGWSLRTDYWAYLFGAPAAGGHHRSRARVTRHAVSRPRTVLNGRVVNRGKNIRFTDPEDPIPALPLTRGPDRARDRGGRARLPECGDQEPGRDPSPGR